MNAQPNTLTVGLPDWALESTDPYIVRLRQMCELPGVGHIREWFDELLMGHAWKQALMYREMQAERRSRLDDDDELVRRAMEAYAAKAAKDHAAMPDLHEIAESVDAWEPGPEDVVLALQLKAEEQFAADLLSEEAERDDDYGQESARVDTSIDAIEQLLAWAGRTDLIQRASLATVLATIKARWDSYSDAQRKLINRLVGETRTWEDVRLMRFHHPKKGLVEMPVPVVHRRISTLYERANHAETQALIEEALDRWEEQQAANDEEAHPADTEPAVQVSVDNQARFLDWVARAAKPIEGAKIEDVELIDPKVRKAKPWLERPSYIHVLNAALQNGARTPREAHNRAYAADTLRLADRIVGCSDDGFLVLLNKDKHQTGLVPLADAQVAYPYLPAAAKARMKVLHAKQ